MKIHYSVYSSANYFEDEIMDSVNEIISNLESKGNRIIDVRVQTDFTAKTKYTTVTILYEFSEEKLSEILKKPRIQTF